MTVPDQFLPNPNIPNHYLLNDTTKPELGATIPNNNSLTDLNIQPSFYGTALDPSPDPVLPAAVAEPPLRINVNNHVPGNKFSFPVFYNANSANPPQPGDDGYPSFLAHAMHQGMQLHLDSLLKKASTSDSPASNNLQETFLPGDNNRPITRAYLKINNNQDMCH